MDGEGDNFQKGELLIYQTEDGKTKVDAYFEDDTVWLNQSAMAALFQKTPQNITQHIKNIYSDGELDEVSNWEPEPEPEWVTAIPSLRHPDLVPDLARRIAAKLGIPYYHVLAKTKDTAQQKTMENSSQQARNALDAFSIAEDCPEGPVLLIDDMVDSKWTLTVCGALLHEAGSGPVFPLVLAATWSGGDSD